ncbi:MAG: dihydropteroate synthase [Thermodesulfobacteriota bacterium]
MKPYTLSWGNHSLVLGGRTLIMGVLNITPDSFSDGGKFEKFTDAIAHARQMIADGADLIDIGGESTRPFSDPIPAAEEINRTAPIIREIVRETDIPISIDTTKAAVAEAALTAGACIINDISALRGDPKMAPLAADAGVPIILMHMQGTPKIMQQSPSYQDVTGEVINFLQSASGIAEKQGISSSKIFVDPGIGFGKTAAHNLTLIKNLFRFRSLGLPVVIGTSRKAFIRKTITGHPEKDLPPDMPAVITGTQATIAAAILGGANIVRVHDVAEAVITARITDAIKNAHD